MFWRVCILTLLISGCNAGTPLHHAAKRGLENTVKLLLSHGGKFFLISFLPIFRQKSSFSSLFMLFHLHLHDGFFFLQQIHWLWMTIFRHLLMLLGITVTAMLYAQSRYASNTYIIFYRIDEESTWNIFMIYNSLSCLIMQSHICLFSGWMRQFYGTSFQELFSPQLLSRRVWVSILFLYFLSFFLLHMNMNLL